MFEAGDDFSYLFLFFTINLLLMSGVTKNSAFFLIKYLN